MTREGCAFSRPGLRLTASGTAAEMRQRHTKVRDTCKAGGRCGKPRGPSAEGGGQLAIREGRREQASPGGRGPERQAAGPSLIAPGELGEEILGCKNQ